MNVGNSWKVKAISRIGQSKLMKDNLFDCAWEILGLSDPMIKVTETFSAYEKFSLNISEQAELGSSSEIQKLPVPGRPVKPELVLPKELTKRSIGSLEGRAALLHAICHIEFNAINLAWDAIYRFRGMPAQYYFDWLKVAKEEAYHFSLLNEYLNELGFAYGDFPAHNGLWDMAVDTDHDVLVRMALVPRVLEARGLDVTPGIMKKFTSVKDTRANEILAIIQEDEIGHVEIGSRWFHYCCDQRELDHDETFRRLLNQYLKGGIKKPINQDARLRAGFSQEELNYFDNNLG